MRADFQHHYHLNIEDMGKSFSVRHACSLVRFLPHEGAVSCAIDPDNIWGLQEVLLGNIQYHANLGWYVHLSKKDRRKNKEPEPVVPQRKPSEPTKGKYALPLDEYQQTLNRLRGGSDGN